MGLATLTFLAGPNRFGVRRKLTRILSALIVSVLPSTAVILAVQQATAASGVQSEAEIDTSEILNFASAARATPITEPGIPAKSWASTQLGNQVKGHRDESASQVGDNALILTEKIDPQFKFYVQGIFCTHRPGKVQVKVREDSLLVIATAQGVPSNNASLWDATLLGLREGGAAFYDANLTFRVVGNSVNFPACMAPGMTFSQPTRGSDTMLSHDRVLAQMCNWLRFLAQSGDNVRSADFLTTILAKHKQVLLQEDSAQEIERLAADIDLFDQWFPFEVWDGVALSIDQRAQARDFLRTTIALRRKLQLLAPAAGNNIARDEALERRMR